MDKSITINGSIFYGCSFSYVVGFDLVTYDMEDTTEFIYVHPKITNRFILEVINYRNESLEHLVRNVHRWQCSGIVRIKADSPLNAG